MVSKAKTMKIELSSEQLRVCWDAMKHYHKIVGYNDKGLGGLATKLYGLWQDSIYQDEIGGDPVGSRKYREYKETEGEPSQDGVPAPGLAEKEPGLQQRVSSSLHEGPESESSSGSGEGRQDPGGRTGSGKVPGAQGESSGTEHQEEAVRDSDRSKRIGVFCLSHSKEILGPRHRYSLISILSAPVPGQYCPMCE